MAGKSAVFQYGFLQLVFNGSATNFSLGSTAGTTSLWIGLHTADPGEACSTANEGGYAAYTRVQSARSTAGTTPYGWAVSSGTVGTVSPVGNLDFPAVATTSTGTFSYFTVWPSSNATSTQAVYVGTVSPAINFGNGVTPRITTGSSITED